MKYSNKARGFLVSQYNSVLKKCFLINNGLYFLAAVLLPNIAQASVNNDYKNLLYTGLGSDSGADKYYKWEYDETLKFYKLVNSDSASADIVTKQNDSRIYDEDYVAGYDENTKILSGTVYSGIGYTANTFLPDGITPVSSRNEINAVYIGNKINSFYYPLGGAISNIIRLEKINGVFIGNGVTAGNTDIAMSSFKGGAYGGAIHNSKVNFYMAIASSTASGSYGHIGEINGKFVGNYVQATQATSGKTGNSWDFDDDGNAFLYYYLDGAFGGAVANQYGTIGDISSSDFVQNIAAATGTSGDAGGAAIYNSSVALRINGGAFDSSASSKIDNIISSKFDGNSAYAENGNVFGGTIFNYAYKSESLIKKIEGNRFENNTSTALNGLIKGRVIGNIQDNPQGTADIYKIQSDFINNSAVAGTDVKGIVYNNGTIGSITGSNFENNIISAKSGAALGGAIANEGKITNGIINSRFIGNSAVANSGMAKGGAIYTAKDLIIGADNGTSEFTGNYVSDDNGITKNNEAVFVDSGTAELKFRLTNGGNILMNDYINGISGYNISISGDNSGIFKLNNNIKNSGSTSISGANLDIGANKIKIDGSVNFAADSSLSLFIKNAENDYGVFKADNISIADGSKFKATFSQDFAINKPVILQLLEANNADFNEFTDVFDNNMYKFEKFGNNGAYKISKSKTASEISAENGGSKINQDTAGAWVDKGAFENGSVSQDIADKFADLAQNNGSSFNDALTAIAPTTNAIIDTVSYNKGSLLFKSVYEHMNGFNKNNEYGVSSGDNPFEEGELWLRTYTNKAKQQQTSKMQGFNLDSNGGMIALEKKIEDKFTLGGGFHYDNTNVSAVDRKFDVETKTGFVYGEYKPNNWFVEGTAAYDRANYKERKYVFGNVYNAEYNTDVYSVQGVTGYDFKADNTKITPDAGMRYYSINRHGYTDTAEQHVSGKSMDILTLIAGIKFQKEIKRHNDIFVPDISLHLTYDAISDIDSAKVSLKNGAVYNVYGSRLNRFGVEMDAGFKVEINDMISVRLSYLGRYREYYQDHTGIVDFKYKF